MVSMGNQIHAFPKLWSPQSITLQAKPAVTDQGDPSRNQLSGVRRKGALLSALYLIVDFWKVAATGLPGPGCNSLSCKRLLWWLGIKRLQPPSGCGPLFLTMALVYTPWEGLGRVWACDSCSATPFLKTPAKGLQCPSLLLQHCREPQQTT